MEQAFQRILTEIYHIVSKKALAQEDGPAAVSEPPWRAGPASQPAGSAAPSQRSVLQQDAAARQPASLFPCLLPTPDALR